MGEKMAKKDFTPQFTHKFYEFIKTLDKNVNLGSIPKGLGKIVEVDFTPNLENSIDNVKVEIEKGVMGNPVFITIRIEKYQVSVSGSIVMIKYEKAIPRIKGILKEVGYEVIEKKPSIIFLKTIRMR